MRVSVVLATYNGQQYIFEQLESIKNQTLTPDEVLIFDDCSNDATAFIVEKYITDNHLNESWKLIVNDISKGCTRNFVDAALSASGDIIFYCDQDDIWSMFKIEKMIEGFQSHNDMLACYCLKNHIDYAGNHVAVKFQFTTNMTVLGEGFKKVSLVKNVKYNQSPGLCLAFKKELITDLKDLIFEYGLTHDLPIGMLASINNGYYVLNSKLVDYRLHSSNVSTPHTSLKSRFDKEYQIRGRKSRAQQLVAFSDHYSDRLSLTNKLLLQKTINYTNNSVTYLENDNVMGCLKQLFSFNPMINHWIALNNFACVIANRRSNE